MTLIKNALGRFVRTSRVQLSGRDVNTSVELQADWGPNGSSQVCNIEITGKHIKEVHWISLFIRASGNWFCYIDVVNRKLYLYDGTGTVTDWSSNWNSFVRYITITDGNLSASFNRFPDPGGASYKNYTTGSGNTQKAIYYTT